MKKQSIEIVRRIFENLKFSIPHPNLEELFEASKVQGKFICTLMMMETQNVDKWITISNQIDKMEYKIVIS